MDWIPDEVSSFTEDIITNDELSESRCSISDPEGNPLQQETPSDDRSNPSEPLDEYNLSDSEGYDAEMEETDGSEDEDLQEPPQPEIRISSRGRVIRPNQDPNFEW
jgi:hypothetical protein